MTDYILNILIALSQLGNTLLGGFPDESMSARAWRTGSQGKWPGVITRPAVDFVFWALTWGKDATHCFSAYESERLRKHTPDHYQRKA